MTPDTILPVQFFDRIVSSDMPEKRLIFAVQHRSRK